MLKLYKKTKDGLDCHDYFDPDRPNVLWDRLSHIVHQYTNPFTGSPEKSYNNPQSKWYQYEGGPAAIQKAWDSFNAERRDIGTSLHKFCEDYMVDGIIPPPKSSYGHVAIMKLQKILANVYPEGLNHRRFKVTCEKAYGNEIEKEWGVCGTPDINVEEHEHNKHGIPTMRVFLDLYDFKQDKEIVYERTKWTKKLLAPLNEVDDISLNVYGIKLWVYWFMIRRSLIDQGYTPILRYMSLLHYNAETCEWKYYNIPDSLKATAALMIKHYFGNPLLYKQPKERREYVEE